MCFFHGIILFLYIFNVAEAIGNIEKSDFESALLQTTGAIILGHGLHLFLTLVLPLWDVSNTPSLAKAMGISLLPRVALILWALVKGDVGGYQFEGSGFLKVNFGIMSWTTFSLLAGVGNANVSTKGKMVDDGMYVCYI